MFELNQNSEEILYGLLYFSISAPPLPLYILVMLAVKIKDREKPNMTYKLINLIFFWQAGQTFAQFVASPILIFPQLQKSFHIGVRIIGSALSMCYNAELPTMAVLGVCRILVFSRVIKTKTMPIGVKLFLTIGILLLFSVFLYSCISGFYIFAPPAWKFDLSVPYAEAIKDVYFKKNCISLAVSYISYVVIVYMIYVRKKQAVSMRSRKIEVSILAQYTIIVIYTTLFFIFWYKSSVWFDVTSPRVQAAINIGWISRAYIDSTLILVFNKPVRRQCAILIGLIDKNKLHIKTIVSSTASDHRSRTFQASFQPSML